MHQCCCGFVLWLVPSWFKTGKAWSGRPGNGGLWHNTSLANRSHLTYTCTKVRIFLRKLFMTKNLEVKFATDTSDNSILNPTLRMDVMSQSVSTCKPAFWPCLLNSQVYFCAIWKPRHRPFNLPNPKTSHPFSRWEIVYTYLDSVQIIHSQNGTSLVLIGYKTKTLRFSWLFIPNKVDVDNLSIPKSMSEKNS